MASQDIQAEDKPPGSNDGSNPLVLLAAGAVLGASGYMLFAKRPLNARGPGVQQAYTAYGAQQSRTSRRHTRPLPGSTQQAPATVNDQRRSGVEPAAAPGLGGSFASSMAGSIVGNVIGSQIGKALGGGGNSQATSGTAASEPVDQDTPPAPGPSNDHVAQEDPYAYTEPQEQQGTNSWGDSGWEILVGVMKSVTVIAVLIGVAGEYDPRRRDGPVVRSPRGKRSDDSGWK